MIKIPIEVSARHIHLKKGDLEALFGEGYELKKAKQLTQPSDFAAEETVDISANGKEIKAIRIVGPVRKETQIEISLTDIVKLGIAPVFKNSGDVENTPGITLTGPKGKIGMEKGLIIALRHIHCNPREAEKIGLKDGDFVSVKTAGERAITFHNVLIRVNKDYRLCAHIDTDEGNAAGIIKRSEGVIIS